MGHLTVVPIESPQVFEDAVHVQSLFHSGLVARLSGGLDLFGSELQAHCCEEFTAHVHVLHQDRLSDPDACERSGVFYLLVHDLNLLLSWNLENCFPTLHRCCMLCPMSETVEYQISRTQSKTKGIFLSLVVDDKEICTAKASEDVVYSMSKWFGLDPKNVELLLHDDLVAYLKHSLGKFKLSNPEEAAEYRLRFKSHYTYQENNNITIGMVWYDISKNELWPEDVPNIIQNSMRTKVIRLLTLDGGVARKLIDSLRNQ